MSVTTCPTARDTGWTDPHGVSGTSTSAESETPSEVATTYVEPPFFTVFTRPEPSTDIRAGSRTDQVTGIPAPSSPDGVVIVAENLALSPTIQSRADFGVT